VLECVINISEGREAASLADLGALTGAALLDLHADPFHNRSVFTLAGPDALDAALVLAAGALDRFDLSQHEGVHPRLGVVDVVPFTPLGSAGFGTSLDLGEAVRARDAFCVRAAHELDLPCFRYGPERSLPEIRRRAFVDLSPDTGPPVADARRGACCVGARPCLIAYNLIIESADVAVARRIASRLRSPEVRALGFVVGDDVHVSCNLIAPWTIGPAEVYDAVAATVRVLRTELVGLVPAALLAQTPRRRWAELDLGEDRTIEARFAG
jgi:glutamate formiminotransferase/glutamate formiminotransferase/formiminotetrahydrofolate cyclodeaminase